MTIEKQRTTQKTLDREDEISEFMKANADGVSTASIQQELGISKNECAATLNRMKSAGRVISNGLRGNNRWVFHEKKEYPLVGSIWQYVDGKFSGISIARP